MFFIPLTRMNLIYLTLVLHGIGVLMPWNMIITAKEHKSGDWIYMLTEVTLTFVELVLNRGHFSATPFSSNGSAFRPYQSYNSLLAKHTFFSTSSNISWVVNIRWRPTCHTQVTICNMWVWRLKYQT